MHTVAIQLCHTELHSSNWKGDCLLSRVVTVSRDRRPGAASFLIGALDFVPACIPIRFGSKGRQIVSHYKNRSVRI